MTRDTCCAGEVEVPIRMALFALQLRVASGKRKPYRVVIEVRRLPRRRIVALLATLRQSERQMVRVACLLVVRQVATYASCRRTLILPPDVAGCALQGRVHSS